MYTINLDSFQDSNFTINTNAIQDGLALAQPSIAQVVYLDYNQKMGKLLACQHDRCFSKGIYDQEWTALSMVH